MNTMGLPSELSIWEIAHRWHKADGSKAAPLDKVLDTLRWICEAIDAQELVAVDYRMPADSSLTVWERLPNFRKAQRAGAFNKTLLDGVFVLDDNFARFCLDEGKPPPTFWFGEDGSTAPDDGKPRTDAQEDRIRCRTIAQILWDQDPSLTVEALGKHPWMHKYGNGGQYKGKATIRNWIKDLNPKPADARRGRPKKPKK